MTIKPDDPWYPNPYTLGEVYPHSVLGGCPTCRGVTIRLNLATEMMKSPNLSHLFAIDKGNVYDAALKAADAMIERANRDEGKTDEG